MEVGNPLQLLELGSDAIVPLSSEDDGRGERAFGDDFEGQRARLLHCRPPWLLELLDEALFEGVEGVSYPPGLLLKKRLRSRAANS